MIPSPRLLSLFAAAGLLTFSAFAEEKPPAEEAGKKPESEKKEDVHPPEKKPEEKPKESKGSVTIAGTEIKYVAKTGTLPLLKEDGSGEKARVFFVYYTALDAD